MILLLTERGTSYMRMYFILIKINQVDNDGMEEEELDPDSSFKGSEKDDNVYINL